MSQRPGPFRAVAEYVYAASIPIARVAGPDEVSVGLVVGRDAALLVDTGSTPAQGRLLRQGVAAQTSVPLTTVVLTHWHSEHSFGLAGTDVAVSIAHETAAQRLAESGLAAEAMRLGVSPADLPRPSRPVAVVAALDLGGGVRVEVVHLGRGHTDGDLVVVVPASDVAFAGDLVAASGPPRYGPDSFPHEWPATLDGLIGLTTDGSVVLPGHGGPMDRKAVFEQRSRIAAVASEISRLAALGVGVDDAETRGDWALPFATVRAGYEVGYTQARPAAQARSLPLL
jgi:glyoxylase-like metal-dependent hydrolase (beta-lactamase superfamily II)